MMIRRYPVNTQTKLHWQIPPHTVTSLRPKRKQYCLCVFVLNEGDRIQKQLHVMMPFAEIVDIIIADGGSTDEVLTDQSLLSSHVTTLLVKHGPGQLSAQMRMAFAWGLSKGYKGIITIDGNNKDDVQAIPRFIQKLNEGYDHVQGSRYISGGKAMHTPVLRDLGLRYIHAPLISLAAGFHYTDTTNGFRAYSAKFLSDPAVALFRDVFNCYELHYYLAIQAVQRGYRVTEIPVTRRYPVSGAIPTKISPFWGSILIFSTLLRAITHQFDPKH